MKTLQKILSILILLSFIGIGNVAASAMVAVAVSSPTPVYPINGALVLTDTPTLKWTASTPAAQLDHYEYQVSRDSGFHPSAIVVDDSTTNTQVTVGPLVRSYTYYWRIRACDTSANCTGWAQASFRVSVAAPTLVSPADGDTLFTNRDTFKWSGVLNASGYTIQISGSSAFSSVLLQADVPSTQTEYTPSADLPVNRLLFWRVRAKNPNYGPGPWSSIWSFYTANPPSTPEPAKPDGKLTTDISPRLFWKPITVPSGTTFEKYHVQVDNNSDFSSPEIDDDTLTTLTPYYYDVPDPSPLNDAKTYYWRVRACNNDGTHTFCSTWSKVSSFLTSVGPIPALNTPANGDVLTDNRPTFDWDNSNGARSYTIQIARDPRFNYIVLTAGPFNSQFTPDKNLPPGQTLYWRVRGEHPVYGPGLWSVVYSFTTARPPAQPSLRSPANDSLVHSNTPDLTWSFSPTPVGTTFDYYHLQIDDNPAFASPEENQNISNQFTPYFLAGDYSAALARMRTYYWRVRACNTDGACSDWSSVYRFRIAIEPPTGLSCSVPTVDWDDMRGASSYRLIIAQRGTILRNIVTSVSQANVFGLPTGTYTCRVRVESTFGLPYSPSLWALDTLIVP